METAPALYYTICMITITEVSRVVLQFQKHMSFPKFVDIACHVVTLNFADVMLRNFQATWFVAITS